MTLKCAKKHQKYTEISKRSHMQMDILNLS